MAIFAKRLLKEMLSQNARLILDGGLDRQFKALDSGGIASLSVEWEIVILNTFSKIGHVEYEKSFGGKGFPDLFFRPEDGSAISFLADITTVSDSSYEEESPIEDFIKEACQILRKHKIRLNSFHYEIGDTKVNRGVKLKIPPKGQFQTVFKNSEFQSFIAAIKEAPSKPHYISLSSAETEVRFYYDPQKKYGSGRYASINCAHSLTNNPVYNSLKSKAVQLKKSQYKGIRAIFLCDGGCGLLTSSLRDWRSYGLNDIVNEFFRQYSSVDFIAVFAVKEDSHSSFSFGRKIFIEVKPFLNPASTVSPEALSRLFENLLPHLPLPVNTAKNAFHKVKDEPEIFGTSFYGGFRVENNIIKIPARGLLELLSERVELKQFLQDHGQAPTDIHPANQNYFALRFNEGRLINDIRIEKSIDRDDDWIVFEFGNPDPAVCKYKIPKDKIQGVGQSNVS